MRGEAKGEESIKKKKKVTSTRYAIGYLGGDNLVAIEVNDGSTSSETLSMAEKVYKKKNKKKKEKKRKENEKLMINIPN